MSKRRDLIRMTDEEVDAFLQGRNTMNIATHGPDGRIHLVAMWYGFVDGKPAFETYAKSQKVLNLQRNPQLTALVETGDQYDELKGVELVGEGRITDDPDVVMECARSVVDRYFGVDRPEDLDAVAEGLARKRVAIIIEADKVVSWDHTKLAGGY
jgi:PPOX class probable F420-dependent enzyme